MIKKGLLFLLVLFGLTNIKAEKQYFFKTRHMVIDYFFCDDIKINCHEAILIDLIASSMQAGSEPIHFASFHSENGNLICSLILNEAHITIHTYPEFGHCFIDFFNCGDQIDFEIFNSEMKKRLSPQMSYENIFDRGFVEE